MSGSVKQRQMSTEQDDSDYNLGAQIKSSNQQMVQYRPYSPPFAQITSEQSEIEEVMDTDFVPTKNLDI